MREPRAIYVGLCAACVAFAMGLLLPSLTDLPQLWYLPLEHRWTFERPAGALAMGWYGTTLYGVAAGCVAYVIASLTVGRAELTTRRSIGWALLAAVSMGVYVHLLLGELDARTLVPEPLPPGYQPR